MPPIARFILVGLIGAFMVSATHTYIYRRLVRDVTHSTALRRLGGAVIALAALVMIAGLPGNRMLPRDMGVIVGYAAFGWMGIVAITVMVLAVLDVARLPLSMRLKRRGELPDATRRQALSRGVATVAAIGATSTSAVAFAEADDDPTIREIDVPIGVPAPLRGLRIVQVSDIHVGPTIGAAFMTDLVARINALNPDVVAITGDLVDGTVERLGRHTAPLGDLKARHGVFFVTGNHEYYSGADAWIAELTRLGIKVLRNERVTVTHDGAEIDIAGVDDWRAKSFGGDHGPNLPQALHGRDETRPVVLLAHQPKAIHEAAKLGVDLVLSGHTHGGQMLPFAAIVKLVQPYVKGLHRHGDRTWIYVHSGTGYWGPPMRLAVPAEIAVLTLA